MRSLTVLFIIDFLVLVTIFLIFEVLDFDPPQRDNDYEGCNSTNTEHGDKGIIEGLGHCQIS